MSLSKIEKMQSLSQRITSFNEDLSQNNIPFDIRSERVEGVALLEYARENYWILEEAVAIAKELEELGL